MPDALDELVAAARASRKYAAIHEPLVRRIAAAELAKGRKPKEALKAVKNKLHQVGAAYQESTPDYPAALESLQAAPDVDARKTVCRELMMAHASTRERLPILETFYDTLFAHLPPIHSVLDVACGLNPLAVPWMALALGASYTACDIYEDMLDLIGKSLPLLGVEGRAVPCDILAGPPAGCYDLALALKTIPCLEQVDKDAGARLLDSLDARFIVVSFPVASLGGRAKGMPANYAAHFTELTEGKGWVVEKKEFETELVFVVQKS